MAESQKENIVKKSIKRLGSLVRNKFKGLISSLKYDLLDDIENNEIAKSRSPRLMAVKWYRENYMRNNKQYVRGKLLEQGKLYIFDYKNPKHKDTLDFYDTQPLVLSLGTIKVGGKKKGDSSRIHNIGLNLHLLPPKVRQLVMFEVYYLYKSAYRKNLNRKNEKSVKVSWQKIAKKLDKYGVGFCIRQYIPERQNNVIVFKQEDWAKAIYIPSAGYAKIGPLTLQKEWAKYLKENKGKVFEAVVNENHSRPV